MRRRANNNNNNDNPCEWVLTSNMAPTPIHHHHPSCQGKTERDNVRSQLEFHWVSKDRGRKKKTIPLLNYYPLFPCSPGFEFGRRKRGWAQEGTDDIGELRGLSITTHTTRKKKPWKGLALCSSVDTLPIPVISYLERTSSPIIKFQWYSCLKFDE